MKPENLGEQDFKRLQETLTIGDVKRFALENELDVESACRKLGFV